MRSGYDDGPSEASKQQIQINIHSIFRSTSLVGSKAVQLIDRMAISTSRLVSVTLAIASCALWTTSVASAVRGPTVNVISKTQRQLLKQRRKNLVGDDILLLLKDIRGGGDRGGYGYGNGDNYGYGDGAAAGNDDDAYYRGQQGPSSSRDTYRDHDDYYDEQDPDDYDGRRSSSKQSSSRKSKSGNSIMSSLPSIIQNGDRRIGFLLLGSGTVVTMMGITLFFQRTLMRLGNLLVIAGVPMTLGPQRTLGYFYDPQKMRATVCLAAGIFLVLVAGRPIPGIALEIFGLLNLFGNMFPVVLAVLKTMPVIGPLLSGKSSSGGSNNNSRRSNNSNNNYSRERQRPDDDYYYEGNGGSGGRDQQGGDYYGYDDRGDDASGDRFY
jgi:hypothetical protein